MADVELGDSRDDFVIESRYQILNLIQVLFLGMFSLLAIITFVFSYQKPVASLPCMVYVYRDRPDDMGLRYLH
jgi:hypothetical protein